MTRTIVIDLAIGVLLAVGIGAVSWQRSAAIDQVVFRYEAGGANTSDVWFDADLPKMMCLSTDRLAGQHSVTSEHPLISLLTFAPIRLAGAIGGATPLSAIRGIVAIESAIWIGALFALMRMSGAALIESTVFAILAAVSAAATFWTVVPEAFLPGAITLIIPLLIAARWQHRRFRDAILVCASAATLAVTVTNWIGGLALAFAAYPWRRAAQVSANALMVVSVLWLTQSLVFPENVYFLGSNRALELLHNKRPDPLEAAVVMVSHAMVMPQISVVEDPHWRGLTVQSASIGSSGWLGVLGAVLWAVLLLAGAVRIAAHPAGPVFRFVLFVSLAAQGMFLIFGTESFLYVMPATTLLIIVASCGATGTYRAGVVAVAGMLIVVAALNNARPFAFATEVVSGIGRAASAADQKIETAGRCDVWHP